ncbi:hypothetical protein BKA64DRAFT_634367 [Cadophora sp. MPI-SDFR-AT-0126]|nr:hypothetical protein BKA64DRAFT_634367 [Leotiomycetes sp. MPI-SDFR-AT-0126]
MAQNKVTKCVEEAGKHVGPGIYMYSNAIMYFLVTQLILPWCGLMSFLGSDITMTVAQCFATTLQIVIVDTTMFVVSRFARRKVYDERRRKTITDAETRSEKGGAPVATQLETEV